MVMSINTNVGAMLALQNLNKSSRELFDVQTRINTGLRVSGPKDDGAVYAIAQNMRGDVRGYMAVRTALNNSIAIVDVAIAAGEAISDILIEMKEKTVAAMDQSLDTTSRNALNSDFTALRDQISNIVNNAEFNGTNLLNGTLSAMTVLANPDGSSMTVTGQNMIVGTAGLNLAGDDLTTASNATLALSAINAAAIGVNQDLGLLGTRSRSLDTHATFVGKLIDSLNRPRFTGE